MSAPFIAMLERRFLIRAVLDLYEVPVGSAEYAELQEYARGEAGEDDVELLKRLETKLQFSRPNKRVWEIVAKLNESAETQLYWRARIDLTATSFKISFLLP